MIFLYSPLLIFLYSPLLIVLYRNRDSNGANSPLRPDLGGDCQVKLTGVVHPRLTVLSVVASGAVVCAVPVDVQLALGVALFAARRLHRDGAVHHRLVKVTLNGERVVGQLGDLAPGE